MSPFLTIFRFAAVNLDHKSKIPGYLDLVKALEEDDTKRSSFLAACLLKLGLKLNVENKEVPSLSRLHLSSAFPGEVSSFMESLKEVIGLRDGKEYLQDDNDTFCFEKASQLDVGSLVDALPAVHTKTTNGFDGADDRDIDFDAVVKHVIVHEKSPPSSGATIHFNHGSYYSDLERYRSQQDSNAAVFGHCILYADVVTSTNTILEKYVQLVLPVLSFADH